MKNPRLGLRLLPGRVCNCFIKSIIRNLMLGLGFLPGKVPYRLVKKIWQAGEALVGWRGAGRLARRW